MISTCNRHYRWSLQESHSPPNKIMNLKIEFGEQELAQQVKSLGVCWDRQKKVWKLLFRYVQGVGLNNLLI